MRRKRPVNSEARDATSRGVSKKPGLPPNATGAEGSFRKPAEGKIRSEAKRKAGFSQKTAAGQDFSKTRS